MFLNPIKNQAHVEFGDRASLGYDLSINDPENDGPVMEPGEDSYVNGTPMAGIIDLKFGVAKGCKPR